MSNPFEERPLARLMPALGRFLLYVATVVALWIVAVASVNAHSF